MPGPVDPARLLVCELVEGPFESVSGPLRPEWENVRSESQVDTPEWRVLDFLTIAAIFAQ